MTKVFRYIYLKDNSRVKISVSEKTRSRLETTCFRGKHLALSGNFQKWGSIEEFLDDRWLLEEFSMTIQEALDSDCYGTNSVTLQYESSVGWSSTASLSDFPSEDLEEFYPNKRSTGLRVKPSSRHFLAPQTSHLTIVFEIRLEKGCRVIIHSIYPGEDIGEVRGYVSAREGVAFFSWDHEGAFS